jgi:hypothetical protein
MSVEEYVASLETNAMTLGIVALNMKNFACQIIQHVNGGGPLDDAGLATLKAKMCAQSKKYCCRGAAFGTRGNGPERSTYRIRPNDRRCHVASQS